MGETSAVQSVKDYLERPRLLTTSTVPVAPDSFYNVNLQTSASFRNLINSAQWDRLRGAVGFRATIRFTLVVAATPFHSGILYMSFQYGVNSGTAPNWNRGAIVPTALNLPHVRLHLAENSMAVLDIPYVASREYFPIDQNIENGFIDYGTLNVGNIVTALTAAGQLPPIYSVYVSLHDLELIGAVPYNTSSVILQAGEVLKEAKAKGVVSNTLGALADVAKGASKIPSLSAIGGYADWMLRILANTADAFGYSKPTDENNSTKMIRYSYAGESQIDMPFEGFVLSPFASNKLAISPAVGCNDEDQMLMSNVLQKYSMIYSGVLTETNAVGDFVYGAHVTPSAFWYRDHEVLATGNIALPSTAAASVNAFIPSTLCYVGDNFRYWRGSLKFRVSFAKTKLHGGRVQLTYTPYMSVANAGVPLSNTITIPENPSGLVQPIGYSQVFDLKDGSVLEMEVPYISPEPYTSFYWSTGSLALHVVNPVRSTGNQTSAVYFIVEVAAGDDFEFAVVKPSIMAPVAASGTTAIRFQSGLEHVSVVSKNFEPSQNIIGEKITSLKQLIMMPDWFVGDLANANSIQGVMVPWFKHNSIPLAVPISNTANALFYGARSSRIAHLFAFVTGGTDYIVHHDGQDTNTTITARYNGNDSGSAVGAGSLLSSELNPYGSVYIPETLASARFRVPLFAKYMRIPVCNTTAPFGASVSDFATDVTYTNAYTCVKPVLSIRNNSGASRRYAVGRAAADDALASQFIGPPPCTLFQSTMTVSPVSGLSGASRF
ncbi:structural protein [Ginkgoaceae-associated picorna-like virus 1]|nr:structural protein [Ginkgoaceae-associated picorna-like virus 1]